MLCAPAAAGTFRPTVLVNDSLGALAQSATSVIVSPLPQILTLVATPSSLVPNSTFELSVISAGGTGPLGFAYQGLPGGCASADIPVLTCHVTEPGFFLVTATVTDATGASASDALALTVVAFPPITASLTVVPAVADLGSSVTILANLSGGVEPVTESFSGLPSGCVPPGGHSFVCTPRAAGHYAVSLSVRDAGGRDLQRTATFEVVTVNATGPSGTGPPSGVGAGWPEVFLLGLGSGFVGALIAAVWWRRRGRAPLARLGIGPGSPDPGRGDRVDASQSASNDGGPRMD